MDCSHIIIPKCVPSFSSSYLVWKGEPHHHEAMIFLQAGIRTHPNVMAKEVPVGGLTLVKEGQAIRLALNVVSIHH